MRMQLAAILLIVVAPNSVNATVGDEPLVQNHIAEGNLTPNVELGCIAVSDVGLQSNPVDLFLAARECIEINDFAKARELIVMGHIRGQFDAKRVVDKTAHQAVTVAKMGIFGSLDEATSKKLTASLEHFKDVNNRLDLCESAKRLGAPQYHPTYMISHGLEAFTGENGSGQLAEGFDGTSTYLSIVDDYLKCAGPKTENKSVSQE